MPLSFFCYYAEVSIDLTSTIYYKISIIQVGSHLASWGENFALLSMCIVINELSEHFAQSS